MRGLLPVVLIVLSVASVVSIFGYREAVQLQEQRGIIAGDYVTLVSWSGPGIFQDGSDGLPRFADGTCSFTVKKGSRTIVLEVPSNRALADNNLEPHHLLAVNDVQDGTLRYLFHDPVLAQRMQHIAATREMPANPQRESRTLHPPFADSTTAP